MSESKKRGRQPKQKIMPETQPEPAAAELKSFTPQLLAVKFAGEKQHFALIPFDKIKSITTEDFNAPTCVVNGFNVAHSAFEVIAALKMEVVRVTPIN